MLELLFIADLKIQAGSSVLADFSSHQWRKMKKNTLLLRTPELLRKRGHRLCYLWLCFLLRKRHVTFLVALDFSVVCSFLQSRKFAMQQSNGALKWLKDRVFDGAEIVSAEVHRGGVVQQAIPWQRHYVDK